MPGDLSSAGGTAWEGMGEVALEEVYHWGLRFRLPRPGYSHCWSFYGPNSAACWWIKMWGLGYCSSPRPACCCASHLKLWAHTLFPLSVTLSHRDRKGTMTLASAVPVSLRVTLTRVTWSPSMVCTLSKPNAYPLSLESWHQITKTLSLIDNTNVFK